MSGDQDKLSRFTPQEQEIIVNLQTIRDALLMLNVAYPGHTSVVHLKGLLTRWTERHAALIKAWNEAVNQVEQPPG